MSSKSVTDADQLTPDDEQLLDSIWDEIAKGDLQPDKSLFNQKQISATKSLQPRPQDVGERDATTPAYIVLSLANDPALISLQTALKAKLPEVQWENPTDFHITLVYIPEPPDMEQLAQAIPAEIAPIAFRTAALGTFDSGNDAQKPLYLTVIKRGALVELQDNLVTEVDCDVSDYSNPETWQPHITLGYYPTTAEPVQFPNVASLDLQASRIVLFAPNADQDGDFQPLAASKAMSAATAPTGGIVTKGKDATSPANPFRTRSTTANPDKAVVDPLEEYNRYWQRFDALETAIQEAWLDDYMKTALPEVEKLVKLQGAQVNPAQVQTVLDQLPVEALLVGTYSKPGPLAQIMLAGYAAGQDALEHQVRTGTPVAPNPKAAKGINLGVSFTLPSQEAIKWVQSYAFDLIKGINDTTMGLLRDIFANALVEGHTIPQITEAVRGVFNNPVRANLIARTEALRAFRAGQMQRYGDAGVKRVIWRVIVTTPPACPLCLRLNGKEADLGAGWYDPVTDKTYVNGGHPGCRCSAEAVL